MAHPMTRQNPGAGNVAAGLAPQQSAFPYGAGYVAPPRQNQRPVVRATTPASSRGTTGDPVADAYTAMLNASSQFQAFISRIDGSLYTDGGSAQIAAFRQSPAYLAVGTAVQAVEDSASAADDASVALRSSLQEDDNATDPAVEARGARVWARQKAELDAAPSGGKLYDAALQAITNATPNERRVLATEIGPYLRSRGQKSTDWVDAALRQVDPTYSAAVDDSASASTALTVTLANAAALDKAIGNTYSPLGYNPPFLVDPSNVG